MTNRYFLIPLVVLVSLVICDTGAPGIFTNSYGYPVSASEALNGSRNEILHRRVHVYGPGARGYFKVTHDVSHITNAKVFNGINKITPLVARLSTTAGKLGSSELLNRGKGFAMKFYTEEGNMDLIGLVSSVFALKDLAHIQLFSEILAGDPKTGVVDSNAIWDFVSNHPESLGIFIRSTTSAGQPKSYSFINAHAIHTFQVENAAGDVSFVRFNWFADAGNQILNDTEYATLAATNPNYYSQTFNNDIAKGSYPSYTLCFQVVPQKDLPNMKFDIFDVTLEWPEDELPNMPIGKIVLDKHVDNYFDEIEPLAFNCMNLPAGVRGMDNIFFARGLLYRERATERLGTGFNKIPVNCPISGARTYNRDGNPPLGDNAGSAPNYYPNSFNGLVPTNRVQAPLYRPNTNLNPTNYWQVAKFYNELPQDDKDRMVRNLSKVLAHIESRVSNKVLDILKKADESLASLIKQSIANTVASSSA